MDGIVQPSPEATPPRAVRRSIVDAHGRITTVSLQPQEWERVEAYRTQHGLQSVSEAVRRLEAIGRRSDVAPWAPRTRQDAVRAALLSLRENETGATATQ